MSRGMQPMSVDPTGQRFGNLTVLSVVSIKRRRRLTYCICRCDCGKETAVRIGSLRGGDTKSCGCVRAARLKRGPVTHGMSNHELHRSWMSMHKRCYSKRDDAYESYGGRGITVCKAWHDFPAFVRDMGPRPVGTTLDRIDNDGPYSPENCRWATWKVQASNRRNSVLITINGRTQCAARWAAEVGITPTSIHRRLRKGWPPEKAVMTPRLAPWGAHPKGPGGY